MSRHMDYFRAYENCRLCPRACGVNRVSGRRGSARGFCGETDRLRIAHVGPHFGEEPPITGKNGSGTVFFCGCSLRCAYCQNHQISQGDAGETVAGDTAFRRIREMIRLYRVHNLNFVTPDHFFPHVFYLVSCIRAAGHDLPVVCNLSGYQSVEVLKQAGDYTDIYLPDFKYSDPDLAARLSRCREYPAVALAAISEMVRQKGFLDTGAEEGSVARKGVLVRHLVLPGKVRNSVDALTALFVEFGPDLPLSLMSQYHPVAPQEDDDLNRRVSVKEFEAVLAHAADLGFREMFVQRIETAFERPPFLPDFRKPDPFGRIRRETPPGEGRPLFSGAPIWLDKRDASS